MEKIKKLSTSSFHEDSELAAKINEIIDRINSIQSSAYITPGPSPYDLNAMSKVLKRGKGNP